MTFFNCWKTLKTYIQICDNYKYATMGNQQVILKILQIINKKMKKKGKRNLTKELIINSSESYPLNLTKYNIDSIFTIRKTKEISNGATIIWFTNVCNKCKKVFKKHIRISNIVDANKPNVLLYCRSCAQKITFRDKYGVDNVFQLQEIKDKRKNTLVDKYGVDSPIKNDKIRKKINSTMLERHGVEWAGQSEEILNTKRKNNLEKYGVTNTSQLPEIKEKFITTMHERYGTVFVTNKYSIDNNLLDSSWEVAFYIYHKDKGHKIERSPKKFEYYVNGKKHNYFPDFRINGKYYEIKGDMLLQFNKSGKVIGLKTVYKNKYSSTYSSKEKFECMKKHHVKLIYSKQIKKYLNYIIKEYDSLDYIDTFKINMQ